MPDAVRPLILLPADPFGEKIGGIQTFVRGFVRFAPEDFETELIGIGGQDGPHVASDWQQRELEGRPLRFLSLFTAPPAHRRSRVPVALRYTLALRRRRAEVETGGRVLQFHRAGTPLALRGRRAPRIQVVHLNVADIYRQRGESRWRLLPGLYHRVEALTLAEMDRIYVVNRDGAEFYRRRHPAIADRVAFLPTWVDETLFTAPDEASRTTGRAALRDAMRLADDTPARLVVFVGRLERQKDPPLLISAFAAAHREASDLRLAVIGDGSLRAATEAAAAASGAGQAIAFLGFQERATIARLLRGADAMLLASAFEGMPISVLEALSSGLPVAAAPVGELPRLLSDPDAGRPAAERSPQALAAVLLGVLAVPRDRAAAAAQALVEPYRARTVLAPFYDAHRELASRAGSDPADARRSRR